MTTKQLATEAEEEKFHQTDSTTELDSKKSNNPPSNKQSLVEKALELRKRIENWKEEKRQQGVPDDFNYLEEFMKESGIGKDWEKTDDEEEQTEEDIMAWNAIPRVPDPTSE